MIDYSETLHKINQNLSTAWDGRFRPGGNAFAAAVRWEAVTRQQDLSGSRETFLDLIREIENVKPKSLQAGNIRVF